MNIISGRLKLLSSFTLLFSYWWINIFNIYCNFKVFQSVLNWGRELFLHINDNIFRLENLLELYK